MKKATFAALAATLLVPATAAAKGGVIWERYPDVQRIGSEMRFTAMVMDSGGAGPMRPIEGVRPLVSFRNSSTGQVVRVRASRSDLNGLSYGSVALPSRGPWDTKITVAGRRLAPSDTQPFRVGIGLTQTIAAADSATPNKPNRSSSPADDAGAPAWLWVASAAAIGSALLVLVMRRRGRWGAT
jgi:hypothetical protein